MNINWHEIAQAHGLSPAEFEREIITAAAAVAAVRLDANLADEYKFTCCDVVSKPQLTVKRVE